MAPQSNNVMAVVFLVDSSATLASEWISVLADYVAPHANYVGSAYPDYQVQLLPLQHVKRNTLTAE